MKSALRNYFLAGSLLLFGIFFYTSYLVHTDIFRGFDYDSMLSLQRSIPREVDIPFSIVTLTGSSEVILLVTGCIFLYVYFRYKHLFFGLALMGMIFVIEIMGKLFIFHPKPPALFARYALNIHLPSSFVVDTAYSFPSGHMSRWAFLAIILLYLFSISKMKRISKYIAVLMTVVFVSIVFISRIYLGEHWFSDVLGGVYLGSAVALLALFFW